MVIRIILLVASLCGYGIFLYRRLHLKAELIPFTLFCAIGLTMVFAGILNCMELFVALIFLGGFVLLFHSLFIRKEGQPSLVGMITPGTVFFAVIVVWFGFLFVGLRYTAYDNFSHWGLIVKNMLAENALPSFKNDIILHQTYPVGSSAFIYFIVKVTGNYSEASTIMAQALLLFASITTIFCFVECKKPAAKIVMSVTAFVTGLVLVCVNRYTAQLIVDGLLPLAALGSFCVIAYYRNNIRTACVLSAIILPYLYLIKTSGMLFVLLHLLLIIGLTIAKRGKLDLKKVGGYLVVCVAMPFIMMFLWNQHVALVYEAPDLSRHALSTEYFSETLNTRSDADKKEITQTFFKEVTSLKFTPNQLMIYMNFSVLALGAALWLLHKKPPKWLIAVLIFANLTYLLYMLSLYGMYMLSMPLEGAKTLSSLGRYCNTILAYLIGLFSVAVLIELEHSFRQNGKFAWKSLLAAAYCGCILFVSLTQSPTTFEIFYKRPVYSGTSVPEKVEAMTADVPLPNQANYFVYLPSSATDMGFAKYVFRYNTLDKNGVFSGEYTNESEMTAALLDCDYLFMMEENEALTSFAADNGFVPVKEHVYKLES